MSCVYDSQSIRVVFLTPTKVTLLKIQRNIVLAAVGSGSLWGPQNRCRNVVTNRVGCFAPFIIAYRASYWLWGLSVHFKLQITGGYDHWSITELPGESQTDIWYHKLNGGGHWAGPKARTCWSIRGHKVCRVTGHAMYAPVKMAGYQWAAKLTDNAWKRLSHGLSEGWILHSPSLKGSQHTLTGKQFNIHYLTLLESMHSNIPPLASSSSPWWPFSSVCSRPHKPTYFPESLTVAADPELRACGQPAWRVSEKWSEMYTYPKVFRLIKWRPPLWQKWNLQTKLDIHPLPYFHSQLPLQ